VLSFWAAKEGPATVVDMLVKAGAQINLQSKYSWTAQFLAAMNGHVAIVEALGEAGGQNGYRDGQLDMQNIRDRVKILGGNYTAFVRSTYCLPAAMPRGWRHGRPKHPSAWRFAPPGR
jgi:ankyrin repeat protein